MYIHLIYIKQEKQIELEFKHAPAEWLQTEYVNAIKINESKIELKKKNTKSKNKEKIQWIDKKIQMQASAYADFWLYLKTFIMTWWNVMFSFIFINFIVYIFFTLTKLSYPFLYTNISFFLCSIHILNSILWIWGWGIRLLVSNNNNECCKAGSCFSFVRDFCFTLTIYFYIAKSRTRNKTTTKNTEKCIKWRNTF